MYKGLVTHIFFDLDHTLWDFEKNSALTFEKIFHANHINIDLDDFLNVYVPQNLVFWKLYRENKVTREELRYMRLKSVFDTLRHPVDDDMINLLSGQYIEHLSTYSHLFPNAVEILRYLSPNYNLHIITNGFQEVQEKKMRNADLLKYFGHVINSESVGFKKPDPKIFSHALQLANAPSDKALMIGDSLEADIMGAMAVGMHALHFDPLDGPKHGLCTIIQDLGEIKNIL